MRQQRAVGVAPAFVLTRVDERMETRCDFQQIFLFDGCLALAFGPRAAERTSYHEPMRRSAHPTAHAHPPVPPSSTPPG